jgi:hypothetical protein
MLIIDPQILRDACRNLNLWFEIFCPAHYVMQIKGKPDEHGMLAINESFTFDVNDSKVVQSISTM